jgi:FAD:protein FMN transferase
MRNHPRFFLFTLLPALLLSGCSSAGWSVKKTLFSMNSTVDIRYEDPSGHIDFASIESLFQRYDALAENKIPYAGVTNVADLNKTNAPVAVSQELYDLLKYAWDLKGETDGYFNPLVGRLSDLWKQDLFDTDPSTGYTPDASSIPTFVPSVPSESEIAAELQIIANSSLTFDEAALTVQRVGEGTIDLGGIAKGYVTELAHRMLVDAGDSLYFINGGNSSIVLGENKLTSDRNFTIGFTGLSGKTVSLQNAVLGTSGVDQQQATVDGKLYSHIVNPKTGSAEVIWYEAVLLGNDAALLDGLSTAFYLMGPEVAASYETKYGIKAMYYKKDGAEFTNHSFPIA